MQNEDDLRGLAKVTDFMRAVSFLFLAIHIYWFLLRLATRNGLDA